MADALSPATPIGVLGAGTMGRGIAQVAATHGHPVRLYDTRSEALTEAQAFLERILRRQAEKGRMTQEEAEATLARITYVQAGLDALADCGLVVEAILEDLRIKQQVFQQLEALVADDTILATNTSSLAVTAIAGACKRPGQVVGAHFFNPAPLMPLVEVIPGLDTTPDVVAQTRATIDGWGKTTVLARDTPGFIVNRVARPFYGEALRLLEEGVADAATIDWAMRELGGFRMGPFELMDLIGNDINFKVTQTVFASFFHDPRYRPSFTQQRMVEAGRLGRKSGRGYYDYGPNAVKPAPNQDPELGAAILSRILTMLINEAIDAVFWNIATPEDVDLAMTKGVNYPKGLLAWADEIGLKTVHNRMRALQETFQEDRYRASPLLRQMRYEKGTFFND